MGKGISRRGRFAIGSGRKGSHVKGSTIGPIQRLEERRKLKETYSLALRGLSKCNRRVLKELDGQGGGPGDDRWMDDDDWQAGESMLVDIDSTKNSGPVDIEDDRTYIHDLGGIIRMASTGASGT